MKCPNCQTPNMQLAPYTCVSKICGFTVTDNTGDDVLTCGKCGEVVLSTRQVAGYDERAARHILGQCLRVGGTVLLYARRALGLRKKELAKVLGMSVAAFERNERKKNVPLVLRLAVAELISRDLRGAVGINTVGSYRGTELWLTHVSSKDSNAGRTPPPHA